MSQRLDRVVLGLDATDAGLLAASRAGILSTWRAAGLVPPRLPALLDELARAARDHRTTPDASEVGSPLDDVRSEVGLSSWVSVAQAADQLQVSERRVCQLLKAEQLVGRRRGRGRGVWEVDQSAVQARCESMTRST